MGGSINVVILGRVDEGEDMGMVVDGWGVGKVGEVGRVGVLGVRVV